MSKLFPILDRYVQISRTDSLSFPFSSPPSLKELGGWKGEISIVSFVFFSVVTSLYFLDHASFPLSLVVSPFVVYGSVWR